jgi:lysozyme
VEGAEGEAVTTRAELFTDVRKYAPGQKLTPAMVTMIDDLADRFGLARVDGDSDWLPYALALIKQFEGCKLTAYPDPGSGGDPWTIGWGSTGPGIAKGLVWTQQQADKRLAEHIMEFARGVDDALAGAPVTAMQKGALVSLAYNIGIKALTNSTLIKKHKAGDYGSAAAQFLLWNRAGGKVMSGLNNRRTAEMQAYKGLPA